MFKCSRFFLLIVLVAVLCIGCNTAPVGNGSAEISLDEAKQVLLAGEVRRYVQPHDGAVTLRLKDGRSVYFSQPSIDWISGFIAENQIEGVAAVIE